MAGLVTDGQETATFLLTDVVGSTELWEDEPEAMSLALARHDEIVGAVVAAHDGVLVKTKGEGDSTFSVFRDAQSAALTALTVRQLLDDEPWSTRRPLRMRMAVHTGPAERRGDDWFGASVNRAARLRSLAPPGAIVLSAVTADLLQGLDVVRLGLRRLRGVRELVSVCALVDDEHGPPDLPALENTNLVPPADRTVGRAEDVTEIVELLAVHRLVTLVGPAGSGKTRLASDVGATVAPQFPDGVWIVELASVDDGRAVAGEMASVLGRASVDGRYDRHAMLIVDGCEHVLDSVAEATVDLLVSAPAVRVLATSRLPLGLRAEVVRPVRPLENPRLGSSVAEVRASPAGALLLERASAQDPDYRTEPDDGPALSRCLRALDGLPLAIEIAATHLRRGNAAELAAQLESDLSHLSSKHRDSRIRHRSMATTLDWSFELLDEGDRHGLEALAVCRGFDTALASKVIGRRDASEMVRRLVKASLATIHGTDRYRLLEPVRQHAEQRLRARAGFVETMDRLVAAMTDRARSFALSVYSDPAVRSAINDDRANFELSLAWLINHNKATQAASLFGLIGAFWFSFDQQTGRRWAERVRPLLERANPAEASSARIADAMLHQGTEDATRQLQRALAESTQAGRRRPAAIAAFWLARELAIGHRASLDERRRAFEEAGALAEEAGDLVTGTWCVVWQAILATEAADLDEAERCHQEALELAREVGLLQAVAESIGGLAQIAHRRGDPRARELIDRAVAIARDVSDPWQLVRHLHDRAHQAITHADLTVAYLDVVEAGELSLEIGDCGQIVASLELAARLHDQVSDTVAHRRARAALDASAMTGALRPAGHATPGAVLELPASIEEALRWSLKRLSDEPARSPELPARDSATRSNAGGGGRPPGGPAERR